MRCARSTSSFEERVPRLAARAASPYQTEQTLNYNLCLALTPHGTRNQGQTSHVDGGWSGRRKAFVERVDGNPIESTGVLTDAARTTVLGWRSTLIPGASREIWLALGRNEEIVTFANCGSTKCSLVMNHHISLEPMSCPRSLIVSH